MCKLWESSDGRIICNQCSTPKRINKNYLDFLRPTLTDLHYSCMHNIIPNEVRSIPVLIEFVWLLCELLISESSSAPRMLKKVSYLHEEREQLQGYSLAKLDLPTELFSRCLKSLPILGSSLPGPLLSLAITQVVDYPLLTLSFSSITVSFN